MKNIDFRVALIILIFFINGCAGYKPIFNATKLNFNINSYLIEGNTNLGNNIYTKLYNLSKNNKLDSNKKNLDLYINVLENKEATSKNGEGKILEYKITLNIEIIIRDITTDAKILNEIFVSSTSYKTQNEYSETIKLENQSKQTLTNAAYQKLLIKLFQIIK